MSGAPNTDITNPTGTSLGIKANLETWSAYNINSPPIGIEKNNMCRILFPTIIRVMCGTINPNKPTVPTTLTAAPLNIPAETIETNLIRVEFTPIFLEITSPKTIILSLLDTPKIIINPNNKNGNIGK